MLDLWTTLKLSTWKEKKHFFLRKFQTKLFSGKKIFEWMRYRINVSEAPNWSNPACPTIIAAPELVSVSFFSLLKIMFAFCLKVEELVRQIEAVGSWMRQSAALELDLPSSPTHLCISGLIFNWASIWFLPFRITREDG